MLFLDEIGELGLDEQAMILRAIEDKRFLPVGCGQGGGVGFPADRRDESRPGPRRGGRAASATISMRGSTCGRSQLPGLAERREDIEPNLDYELDRFAEREGDARASFNKEARERYLSLRDRARTRSGPGNFRDLAASVTRMATFSAQGPDRRWSAWKAEIATADAAMGLGQRDDGAMTGSTEILARRRRAGRTRSRSTGCSWRDVHSRPAASSRSLSEAGRTLFAASRTRRTSANDADRLRKYLARFGLDWSGVGPS
jgi:transcriptional regulatory protein RtcR